MNRQKHRIVIPAPVMKQANVRPAAMPPSAKRHPVTGIFQPELPAQPAKTEEPAKATPEAVEAIDVGAELHDDASGV